MSSPEFAYDLKANLVEWLKGAGVFGDHDRVVEFVCIEQFFRCLPDQTGYWVHDQPDVKTVKKAAELVEEFSSHRNVQEEGNSSHKRYPSKWNTTRFNNRNQRRGDKGSQSSSKNTPAEGDVQEEKKATENGGGHPEAFLTRK